MSILSEGRGVSLWLQRQGNSIEFADYILKIFKNESKISFHRISYQVLNNVSFLELVNWYKKQNTTELKKDYKLYKENKEKTKQDFLDEYYKSDLHNWFILNQEKSLKELDSLWQKKVRWGEFKAFYKKSKLKFKN